MIVEIMRYRLKEGVDEQAFMDENAQVHADVIAPSEGLISRTTAKGADGIWMDIVMWESQEHADAAQATMADPRAEGWIAMIDMDGELPLIKGTVTDTH